MTTVARRQVGYSCTIRYGQYLRRKQVAIQASQHRGDTDVANALTVVDSRLKLNLLQRPSLFNKSDEIFQSLKWHGALNDGFARFDARITDKLTAAA